MKLKRIWIANYKDFRRTFKSDAEANRVIGNLAKEAESMIAEYRFDFTLAAAYDDEGYALFDLKSLKVLPSNEIIIDVEYTGTAK